MKVVLPYFYPTMTVFVDDNPRTLRHLVKALKLENLPLETFSFPQEALTFLNQDTFRKEFVDELSRSEEDMEGDSLTFTPRNLIQGLTCPKRYQQVSVLVVDYEMPGMRGLELCARLKNPALKKILLTGVADETVAIEAFNTGLIHQYIRKHDPDFLTKLKEAISKAQQDYFRELFHIPLEALRQRPESTALIDPAFITFFNELVKKHKIQEYYLMEGTGSFVMVGPDKKVFSLLTLEERHIEAFLDSQSADRLSPQHHQALQKREQLPFYYNPYQAPYFEPDDIGPFLRSPTVLQGKGGPIYTAFDQGLIPLDPHAVFWPPSFSNPS